MTDTKQSNPTKEIYTVDVNQETQTAKVTSEKHKAEFVVSKNRSSRFFLIYTTAGVTPKVLGGKYTSLESAVSFIVDYIKNSKETFAVRSDRLHQERQQRKNAEPKPKNG